MLDEGDNEEEEDMLLGQNQKVEAILDDRSHTEPASLYQSGPPNYHHYGFNVAAAAAVEEAEAAALQLGSAEEMNEQKALDLTKGPVYKYDGENIEQFQSDSDDGMGVYDSSQHHFQGDNFALDSTSSAYASTHEARQSFASFQYAMPSPYHKHKIDQDRLIGVAGSAANRLRSSITTPLTSPDRLERTNTQMQETLFASRTNHYLSNAHVDGPDASSSYQNKKSPSPKRKRKTTTALDSPARNRTPRGPSKGKAKTNTISSSRQTEKKKSRNKPLRRNNPPHKTNKRTDLDATTGPPVAAAHTTRHPHHTSSPNEDENLDIQVDSTNSPTLFGHVCDPPIMMPSSQQSLSSGDNLEVEDNIENGAFESTITHQSFDSLQPTKTHSSTNLDMSQRLRGSDEGESDGDNIHLHLGASDDSVRNEKLIHRNGETVRNIQKIGKKKESSETLSLPEDAFSSTGDIGEKEPLYQKTLEEHHHEDRTTCVEEECSNGEKQDKETSKRKNVDDFFQEIIKPLSSGVLSANTTSKTLPRKTILSVEAAPLHPPPEEDDICTSEVEISGSDHSLFSTDDEDDDGADDSDEKNKTYSGSRRSPRKNGKKSLSSKENSIRRSRRTKVTPQSYLVDDSFSPEESGAELDSATTQTRKRGNIPPMKRQRKKSSDATRESEQQQKSHNEEDDHITTTTALSNCDNEEEEEEEASAEVINSDDEPISVLHFVAKRRLIRRRLVRISTTTKSKVGRWRSEEQNDDDCENVADIGTALEQANGLHHNGDDDDNNNDLDEPSFRSIESESHDDKTCRRPIQENVTTKEGHSCSPIVKEKIQEIDGGTARNGNKLTSTCESYGGQNMTEKTENLDPGLKAVTAEIQGDKKPETGDQPKKKKRGRPRKNASQKSNPNDKEVSTSKKHGKPPQRQGSSSKRGGGGGGWEAKILSPSSKLPQDLKRELDEEATTHTPRGRGRRKRTSSTENHLVSTGVKKAAGPSTENVSDHHSSSDADDVFAAAGEEKKLRLAIKRARNPHQRSRTKIICQSLSTSSFEPLSHPPMLCMPQIRLGSDANMDSQTKQTELHVLSSSSSFNYNIILRLVEAKLTAGLVNSAEDICRETLQNWYKKAHELFQLLRDDDIRPTAAEVFSELESMSKCVAGMWCVYAHLILKRSLVLSFHNQNNEKKRPKKTVRNETKISDASAGGDDVEDYSIPPMNKKQPCNMAHNVSLAGMEEDINDACFALQIATTCPLAQYCAWPWLAMSRLRLHSQNLTKEKSLIMEQGISNIVNCFQTVEKEDFQTDAILQAINVCEDGLLSINPSLETGGGGRNKNCGAILQMESRQGGTFFNRNATLLRDVMSLVKLPTSTLRRFSVLAEASYRRTSARALCNELNQLSFLKESLTETLTNQQQQPSQSALYNKNDECAEPPLVNNTKTYHHPPTPLIGSCDSPGKKLISRTEDEETSSKETSLLISSDSGLCAPHSHHVDGTADQNGYEKLSTHSFSSGILCSDVTIATLHRNNENENEEERISHRKSFYQQEVTAATKRSRFADFAAECCRKNTHLSSSTCHGNPLKKKSSVKMVEWVCGFCRTFSSSSSRQVQLHSFTCKLRSSDVPAPMKPPTHQPLVKHILPPQGESALFDSEAVDVLDYLVEFYRANESDIQVQLDGKGKSSVPPPLVSNVPWFVGQVGIRCIHCRSASNRSCFYPRHIGLFHKALWRLRVVHLDNCEHIPFRARQRFQVFRDTFQGDSTICKDYWKEAATELQLEDENGEGNEATGEGGGGVRWNSGGCVIRKDC